LKIGKYRIPDLDPQKALEFAEAIYNFPEHKASKQGFCDKFNIKMKSGWFGQILASLKKYGLAKVEGDTIKSTDLTERLLTPKPNTNELAEAKLTVFNSTELWKILYSKGFREDNVKKSDFWVYLSEIEGIKGLDRKTVVNKAPAIQKRYISALSYIRDVGVPASSLTVKPTATKIPPKVTGIGGREIDTQVEIGKEPLKIQKGGLYIEIPEDDRMLESIDYAADLLDFHKKRLLKKQENK
jgi:hypothetical protein